MDSDASAAERRGERADLIEAAARLFRIKGFAATSIADITARAGCDVGRFARHFTSKNDILPAAMERMAERHIADLRDVAASLDDPVVAIESVSRLLMSMIEAESAYLDIFRDAANTAPHRDAGEACLVRLAGVLAEVIERGIAAGRFTAPHPALMARIVLGLILNPVHAAGADPDAGTRDPMVRDAILEAIHRILGARPGGDGRRVAGLPDAG